MTSRKTPSKSSQSSPKPRPTRGSRLRGPLAKRVALAKVKDDLSHYLRLAEGQEIVITRHGRPAGVLIGFESEDDWFEYQLENNPAFLRRIASARAEIRNGLGVKLEDLPLSKG
jgi:prevent-host-death family protein